MGTLGIMGDGTTEFSGNVALFDMAAALRWVHEYIHFFGGDPKQISVIGHGSGATSAIHLSMSEEVSTEMINGVVAMSGSAYTKYAVDELPKQSVQQIATINNCGVAKTELEIVRCLRKINAEEIIRRDSQIQIERLQGQAMMRSMTGMATFNPVLERSYDNRGLPSILDKKPDVKVKAGQFRRIPLLTGVTKHETANGFALNEIESVFSTASNFLGELSKSLQLNMILNSSTQAANLLGIGNKELDLYIFKYSFSILGKIISLPDYLKIPKDWEPERIIAKVRVT